MFSLAPVYSYHIVSLDIPVWTSSVYTKASCHEIDSPVLTYLSVLRFFVINETLEDQELICYSDQAFVSQNAEFQRVLN